MQKMEVDEMLDGDETTYRPTIRPSKTQSVWKSNWARAGVGCLVIALLALAGAFAVFKAVPEVQNIMDQTAKKQDIHQQIFKLIFTTDFTPQEANEPLNVKNRDALTDELNSKLDDNSIRVVSGILRDSLDSSRTACTDGLYGNVLELNIVPLFASQCDSDDYDKCKSNVLKRLRSLFKRLSIIPVTIQLADSDPTAIQVKLCRVRYIDEPEESKTQIRPMGRRARRRRTTTTPVPAPIRVPVPEQAPPRAPAAEPVVAGAPARMPKRTRNYPVNYENSYVAPRKARCALCLNKIGLITLDGDDGSDIRDDARTYSNGQYRRAIIVTVYEDSAHKLHLQLDCGGYSGDDSAGNPCSESLSAQVWIDYNDNGYDDSESRLLHRSWSGSNSPNGAYDLELYVPAIDGSITRAGPHTMRITVMPSHEYLTSCGVVDYKETRDYSVNIIPKARYIAAPTTPYVYIEPMCSVPFARLILVLMAGQKGTEIRDDLTQNSATRYNQNQHHMAVTLYEHTIYLLRVQLDCSSQLRTELTDTGCNLAQDVNVWLDFNDDNNFDSSEIGAPYRWPVSSYMPDGIYDLQLSVPRLDDRRVTSRQHRMRIVVTPSDQYRRTCGPNDYSEHRDYYVNIISPTAYIPPNNVPQRYVGYDNITCSPQVGKIILVVMGGEHRTQIRDDPSANAVLGNTRPDQHFSIMLREGVTYLLRMQFECSGHQDRGSSENNCNLPHEVSGWIDLNDDGRFDDSESATPYRWPLTSYLPQGIYDLQIQVPNIDNRVIKSGPHRMRLVVMLNEEYRRKCGMNDYQETREYTVTIVSHGVETAELGGPYLKLSDRVCTQSNGRIVLVIMAGEVGTQIRDDTPNNTVISQYQNRHHMNVTLYENTRYRIRIQLDCALISSRGPLRSDCNLAQDVNIYIDGNNDGRFDESESVVPQRWPLRSSIPLGLYDYEIPIPGASGRNRANDAHLMRVVVKPSEEYYNLCGRTDYTEVREYSLNIVPRTTRDTIDRSHAN